ncbi:PRC-barrel domain-containing protein [Sulfitobacter sp. PR48]|jgi:sporulation protein YlmC with PRC-barrel domain|uniref:PRC-barrel domain-containing protein n=1 Tax=unclassified Sulfitobacter TaxID=196795 RepID=UPI0022AFF1FC|nr:MULTISPECIES: PRC-barrel domain-containing protein [unclassified Sulfitobacter]MCZ4256006.1 PRC-barrel domain-containing protein [Sulfitobacter sp. G21635-S1]MDD9721249.1 PRC-barrel domain-containing protein [Sulfitobacter sp. PR48]
MTNLKQHASTLALIATLTATPAILAAQTATAPADDAATASEQPLTQDNAEAPAEETTDTADSAVPADDAASDTAEVPADDTATDTAEAPADDAMQSDGTDTAEVPADDGLAGDPNQTAEVAPEETAKPVEGQIHMQGENTILADDLMGSNVYSASGESIGEIDDLIVNLDGSVEGAVIGVGGFLGIGEKWVAVKLDSLSAQQDENGNVTLTSSATKADLEAAEPFVTARDMAAAQRSVESMPAEGEVQSQPLE